MRSIDSIKSLPQQHMDETATLGDEQDATASGTPTTHATPPTPAHHNRVHPAHLTGHTPNRPHGSSTGGLTWGTVCDDAAPIISALRGCSLMVEHELPKLRARVRFSSPAPRLRPRSSTRVLFVVWTIQASPTRSGPGGASPKTRTATGGAPPAARLSRGRPCSHPRRVRPSATASPPAPPRLGARAERPTSTVPPRGCPFVSARRPCAILVARPGNEILFASAFSERGFARGDFELWL